MLYATSSEMLSSSDSESLIGDSALASMSRAEQDLQSEGPADADANRQSRFGSLLSTLNIFGRHK
ncbi:MAG: hypothetical protein FWC87_05850 [Acidimicrobiaceae bacterium]|nr:hypothetical protein [Acidimicrobiaceae bacterium]